MRACVFFAIWLILAPALPAASCPAPDDFAFSIDALPATAAAIQRKNLTILAIGGTATLGAPAQGLEFTYPMQLAGKLGARLPGVTVRPVISAVPRQTAAELMSSLDVVLATEKPALVIWGPGANAAGRGESIDIFDEHIVRVIEKIKMAGSDVILMTLQFAPSIALVVNLPPYRSAIIRGAENARVPVLDRYSLMRFWNDAGFLRFDVTGHDERVQVARKMYGCIAEILTKSISNAINLDKSN